MNTSHHQLLKLLVLSLLIPSPSSTTTSDDATLSFGDKGNKSSSPSTVLHVVATACQTLTKEECTNLERFALLSFAGSPERPVHSTYVDTNGTPLLYRDLPVDEMKSTSSLHCGSSVVTSDETKTADLIVVNGVKHELVLHSRESVLTRVTSFCQLHGLKTVDCDVLLDHFGTMVSQHIQSKILSQCSGLRLVERPPSERRSGSPWSIVFQRGTLSNGKLLDKLRVEIPSPKHHDIVAVPSSTSSSMVDTFRIVVSLVPEWNTHSGEQEIDPVVVVRLRLNMFDGDTTAKRQGEPPYQYSAPRRLSELRGRHVYFDYHSTTEFGTLGVVKATAELGVWTDAVHENAVEETEKQERKRGQSNSSDLPLLVWCSSVHTTFDVLPKSLPAPWTPAMVAIGGGRAATAAAHASAPVLATESGASNRPSDRPTRPTHRRRRRRRRRRRLVVTHVTLVGSIDGQSHVLQRVARGMRSTHYNMADIMFVTTYPFHKNASNLLLSHGIGVVHVPVVVDAMLTSQYFASEEDTTTAMMSMVRDLETAMSDVDDVCTELSLSYQSLLLPLAHSMAGSDVVTFTNIASLRAQDSLIGLAARCARVPVVICDPGSMNHGHLPTLTGVTHLMVPSNVARAHWQEMLVLHGGGDDTKQIQIIVAQPGAAAPPVTSVFPPPSPPPRSASLPPPLTIAFIGRLAQTKNPSVFIRVARLLLSWFQGTLRLDGVGDPSGGLSHGPSHSHGPPHIEYQERRLRFVLIGHGLLRPVLEVMVRDFNMTSDDVEFLGRVEHQSVLEMLRDNVDLVLHTTLTNETFGLSNIEAMAASVPVVTFGVGGVADYLRLGDDHGVVVNEPTPRSMAMSVAGLLRAPNGVLRDMGEKGCDYVQTHGLLESDMVERFARAYEDAVASASSHSPPPSPSPSPSLKSRDVGSGDHVVLAGTELSKVARDTHDEYAEEHPRMSFRACLPLWDRTTRMYRGIPLNDLWSPSSEEDLVSDAGSDLGRDKVARAMLEQRSLYHVPEIIRIGQDIWTSFQNSEETDLAFPHDGSLWPGMFEGRGNFYLTTRHKVKHDEEQLRYNVNHGYLPAIFLKVADNYTKVGKLLALETENVNAYVFMRASIMEMIGTTYNMLTYRPNIPRRKSALALTTDFVQAEKDYFAPSNAPGLAIIDNFLSPESLHALRRMLLSSTIWFDVKNGYLGAYFTAGLSTPILTQIEEELRDRMPNVIGELPLITVWAYKCASTSPEGLAIHADMAAVNINLWLTPTEANLDVRNVDVGKEGGGLLVYLTRDEDLPTNWNFKEMNYMDQTDKMYDFIKETQSQRVNVPYRQNRATVFHSRLFHESARFQFKEGYENSRINLTFLFGRPAIDRKLTEWVD